MTYLTMLMVFNVKIYLSQKYFIAMMSVQEVICQIKDVSSLMAMAGVIKGTISDHCKTVKPYMKCVKTT